MYQVFGGLKIILKRDVIYEMTLNNLQKIIFLSFAK